MMNDAENRVNLVSEMNATIANIRSAAERDIRADARLYGAEEVLGRIQAEHETIDTDLRANYTDRHVALMTAVEPAARLKAIYDCNVILDAIEENRVTLIAKSKEATADLNKAKSEKGTSSSELARLRETLKQQESRLTKLLPTPDSLTSVRSP